MQPGLFTTHDSRTLLIDANNEHGGQLVEQLNHAGFKTDYAVSWSAAHAALRANYYHACIVVADLDQSADLKQLDELRRAACLDRCPERSATRQGAGPRASAGRRRSAVGALFNAGSHLATGCLLTPGETCILSPEDGLEWLDSHSDRNGETDQHCRSMLSVASPFSDAPGTVRLLEPRPGSNELLAEALCRGEISGPFILDTAGTRHLYFDLRAVQSSMRLEEPDALVTAYVRKMMAFLLFNRAPRHILMIGLGGGSLVKFCHRHLQGTRLTVVEIDPDVIELREWFHIPADDERLRVILGDGAEFVRQGDWMADILLIDAFDRGGVAPSLASDDFYARAFRCLGPNGVLVMNLAGERGRYPKHLCQLREACPGPVLLVPVEADGNALVFAFAQPVPTWTLESVEATAEELQFEFALEFPRFLQRLRTGHLL